MAYVTTPIELQKEESNFGKESDSAQQNIIPMFSLKNVRNWFGVDLYYHEFDTN
jgi:hypothetical protein